MGTIGTRTIHTQPLRPNLVFGSEMELAVSGQTAATGMPLIGIFSDET
jgi:hypothetical protein